jgi:rubrerythrin
VLKGEALMVATNDTKAISDLEFDLLTVLQNKAEAVQMYDTYIQDAQDANSQPCVELLQKLQQADRDHAQELRRHLQEVMQKGRM